MLITPRNPKQVLLLFQLNKEVNKKLIRRRFFTPMPLSQSSVVMESIAHLGCCLLAKMVKEQKDTDRGKRVRSEFKEALKKEM
jgi:hypothetical protein